jgi:hypothetical protein
VEESLHGEATREREREEVLRLLLRINTIFCAYTASELPSTAVRSRRRYPASMPQAYVLVDDLWALLRGHGVTVEGDERSGRSCYAPWRTPWRRGCSRHH